MRSQEDYENVIKLFQEGLTHMQIAAKTKINHKTVARMIKQHKEVARSPSSPGEKSKEEWRSKSRAKQAPLEHGINWEEKLPLIQNPSIAESGYSPGKAREVEYIRCKNCGGKVVKNFPCVACYQKLICFSDQAAYFNELARVETKIVFPKSDITPHKDANDGNRSQ